MMKDHQRRMSPGERRADDFKTGLAQLPRGRVLDSAGIDAAETLILKQLASKATAKDAKAIAMAQLALNFYMMWSAECARSRALEAQLREADLDD